MKHSDFLCDKYIAAATYQGKIYTVGIKLCAFYAEVSVTGKDVAPFQRNGNRRHGYIGEYLLHYKDGWMKGSVLHQLFLIR